MRKTHALVLAMAAIMAASCSDDQLSIGNTLTEESDKLDLTSATFNVQTRTIKVDSILPGSNECYFGRVKDPETGGRVTSDFFTQLNILETFQLPSEETIVSRDGTMAASDSCMIDLYMDSKLLTCSDTLAAMKMEMLELGTPAEESTTFYSNYDPMAKGLVRADGLTAEKVFTYADLTLSDSERSSSSSYQSIHIELNQPYTDRNGMTYCNYGTYLMQQYYQHPEYFKNAYTFIHNVCPGFYFHITDGLGFYSQIPEIGMRIYYRVNSEDSIYHSAFTLAGTDEVLHATKISHDEEKLSALAEDNSCTYIKSPAGLYTEVTLPVDDILRNHENDSLLASKISFQRINNSQHDYENADVPVNLLLVHKDSLDNFFSKNKLNDNVTSFLNSGSTSNTSNTNVTKYNAYAYENISNLIRVMAKAKQTGEKSEADWVARHPNWNKAVLVPVTLVQTTSSSYYYGSSTTTTGIKHNMSLTSTRLVGGSENPYEPIQLSIVYAKFKK